MRDETLNYTKKGRYITLDKADTRATTTMLRVLANDKQTLI